MDISVMINLRSFVADPYRPERERLINIVKESGMSRARSTANRRKALEQHLTATGMTYAEYEALEQAANNPWDTDADGYILIPAAAVNSMLVATCYQARAAFRPAPPESARVLLRAGAWTTNLRPEAAHWWERFAVVTGGTGAKLSNQRGLRRNAFIGAQPPDGSCEPTAPVEAVGTIAINEEMVEPKVLDQALQWGGEWVGIGASRKMGWGRWQVSAFEVED